MNILGRIRRKLALKIHTHPKPANPEYGLSTEGVIRALENRFNRRSLREMTYHVNVRNYYNEEGGSVYDVRKFTHLAIYTDEFEEDEFSESNFESKSEYYKAVLQAKEEAAIEGLRDLVELNVLEFSTTDGEFSQDHEINKELVDGIRPGPRFEPAVQSLLFIDKTTDSLKYWP